MRRAALRRRRPDRASLLTSGAIFRAPDTVP
jgi:hypothetical protein